jgi:hypothetical protein
VGDNGRVSNTERPDSQSDAEVTIRRAPKFGIFIVGGVVVGLVVTLVVVALTNDRATDADVTKITGVAVTQDVGFWGTVGYLCLFGVPAGLVVGALVAVVLDRVLARRAARLTAERYDVVPETETVDGEIDADDQR